MKKLLLTILLISGCTSPELASVDTLAITDTQGAMTIPMTLGDFTNSWLRAMQTTDGRVSAVDTWHWNQLGQAVHANYSIEQPCDLIIHTDTYPKGDTNFDGIVNLIDFAYMAKTWKSGE